MHLKGFETLKLNLADRTDSNRPFNIILNQSFTNLLQTILHELLTELSIRKVTANLAQK